MKTLLISMLLVLAISPSFAQEVFSKSGEAIQGYDPVAYFKVGKPVKGKSEFSYQWKDATWHFASAQNLEAFKASPETFAPQFGGYCAYGVADGHKATTSPDAWTIVGDKLYLNYNKDVMALWRKDQPGFIQKANANWPTVKKEKD
ncbi:YHS domain-containing (seleno)protein [Chryseolinea lacunae]|uniref:YHS domain-containing protein n=1 Tax=Chryseolinea lacunae TaxID=2801331 RepID=A0ABS1KR28_9BACT|nr:YHS domain-containing (seleno)protein [Chryseolinea lacunae]MBL0741925.1 YHS domain-containing protein [Chryseolinea lacunae]